MEGLALKDPVGFNSNDSVTVESTGLPWREIE